MGDRANVRIIQNPPDPDVWLYSHWGGLAFLSKVESLVQDDQVQGHVMDAHYFTKALVERIVEHDDMLSGIGTSIDDNQHQVLVIDSGTGKTWREDA